MSKPIKKPIRVFYSDMTSTFYATRSYRLLGNGIIQCTGDTFDVTQDIARAIVHFGVEFTPAKPPRKKARR
jgi:hypothetical protein